MGGDREVISVHVVEIRGFTMSGEKLYMHEVVEPHKLPTVCVRLTALNYELSA